MKKGPTDSPSSQIVTRMTVADFDPGDCGPPFRSSTIYPAIGAIEMHVNVLVILRLNQNSVPAFIRTS